MMFEKELCVGCTACVSACPKSGQAISFMPDEEGFFYPVVNEEECVKCGICEKVCFYVGGYTVKHDHLKSCESYAVQHLSDDVLENSQSGGAFDAIARYVMKKGGVIYGAGFDENFQVLHIRAENKQELKTLHGAKYVQSNLEGIFFQVKKDLMNGKLVLFSGTPCQVMGLRSFLQVIYENLILVDIVCYGVPSPAIWERYLFFLEKLHGGKIQYAWFRDKAYGWHSHVSSFLINGEKYSSDEYLKIFSQNIALRKSCYNCQFTNLNRPSDITIGDCWGKYKEFITEKQADRGLSLLLINSKLGQRIFNNINNEFVCYPINISNHMQDRLIYPTPNNGPRTEFWSDYNNVDFDILVKKYGGTSWKEVIKKHILKIRLFSLIKKLKEFLVKIMVRAKLSMREMLWYCVARVIQSMKYSSNVSLNNTFRSILVVRLDEIGDVVLTTPFLRELRHAYPLAHITLVVKKAVYNLVELCPYVNDIETYEKRRGVLSFIKAVFAAKSFCEEKLAGKHYDIAIVPRWDMDYSYWGGLIAWYSGANRRIAFSEKVNVEKAVFDKGYDGFYTDVVNVRELNHEVRRPLELLRYLGKRIHSEEIELWTNDADECVAERLFNAFAINPQNIILCVLLGAGSPRRQWNINNYVDAVQILLKRYSNVQVVLMGGQEASLLSNVFVERCLNAIDFVGKTSLRESIAIFKRCDLVLGGDTGSMHMAAASGMAGIMISCHPKEGRDDHPNSPLRFAPWSKKIIVLQPQHTIDDCVDGCDKEYAHCINQITVKQVVDAMEQQIVKYYQQKVNSI